MSRSAETRTHTNERTPNEGKVENCMQTMVFVDVTEWCVSMSSLLSQWNRDETTNSDDQQEEARERDKNECTEWQ